MTMIKTLIVLCALVMPTVAMAQTLHDETHMMIVKNKDQHSLIGNEKTFTGPVRLDKLFSADKPSSFSGGYVTFEPCSRSNWHSHPAGQLLIVTAGKGYVQEWGQQKQIIEPGDIIWTPAHVKHWHGATEKTAMTHISINEAVQGKAVQWMEKVSDEQYLDKK